MTTLTVTAKGQITLRKDVLRHLGIARGQKVEAHLLPGGRIELQATKPSGSLDGFFGSLRCSGAKPVSIEEMNEVIADAWAGRR